MNWEDERYVRLFTRDTMTWLMWPWEARALFGPLLRKVNRAGVVELGEHGWPGLAVMVGLPIEVVEVGVAAMLKTGTYVLCGTRLTAPNFLVAQECKQTDAQRKRDQRERERALGLDNQSQNVTDGHESGQKVTPGHTKSPAVTDGHSVPSRAVPSRTEERESEYVGSGEPTKPVNEPAPPGPVPGQAPLALVEPGEPAGPSSERRVFDHWIAAWKRLVGGSRVPKLDQKRRGKIRARLSDGYSVADLKLAIDGCFCTPWNIGENPEGRRYLDLELILRDGPHVDKFILAAAPENAPGPKIFRGEPDVFDSPVTVDGPGISPEDQELLKTIRQVEGAA